MTMLLAERIKGEFCQFHRSRKGKWEIAEEDHKDKGTVSIEEPQLSSWVALGHGMIRGGKVTTRNLKGRSRESRCCTEDCDLNSAKSIVCWKKKQKQKLSALKETELQGGKLTHSISPCNIMTNMTLNWYIFKVNNATPWRPRLWN